MVDTQMKSISKSKQCEFLSISRSRLYYLPVGEPAINLELMDIIDKVIYDRPFYGIRRMTHHLICMGYKVNVKRIRRLFRLMDIRPIYPRKNTSKPGKGHKIYPYLLRGMKIERVNKVWATDITWIPMKQGFMYLMAIIDLKSRYVVEWSLSNTMDAAWCCGVLEAAIAKHGKPEIFNTDQGSQFTSLDFTGILKKNEIKISMDGKGRATDNAFIERLWRSVKVEHVHIKPAEGGLELYEGLSEYFQFYNYERPHQSLKYETPDKQYNELKKAA